MLQKRIIVFLLLIIILITTSACTSSTPNNSDGETEEALAVTNTIPAPTSTSTRIPTAAPSITPTTLPALQVSSSDLDGLVIFFWHPWTGDRALALEDQVNAFNNENEWGIVVEIERMGSSSTLYQNVEESLTRGDYPSVVEASYDQLIYWYAYYNTVADLKPYLLSPDWGYSDVQLADIPENLLEQGYIGDELLGLPIQSSLDFLFYNRSWAKELGFYSIPKTHEEFAEQICAAAAAKSEIDETGGWIIDTSPPVIWSWMINNIEPDYFDVFEPLSSLPEEDFYSPFDFMKTFSADGCAWQSRLSSPYQYFANRQALVFSGNLQEISFLEDEMKFLESEDDWLTIPYPGTNQENQLLMTTTAFGIFKTTYEEQLASWIFVQWMNDSQRQFKLALSSDTLPASLQALDRFMKVKAEDLQWEQIFEYYLSAYSSPRHPYWHIVRNILSDTAWQVFQTHITTEDLPRIFNEMNVMIESLEQ